MSIADQLYPLSTEDGTPIPLDIVLPLDVVIVPFAADTETPIAFTANQKYCSIRSTADCLIDFSGLAVFPVLGSDNALLLYADTILTFQLPDAPIAANIIPLESGSSGKVSVMGIRKWAGIGLARQLSQR